MKEVFITSGNCITPLGFDTASTIEAMYKDESGLRLSEKQCGNQGLLWFSEIPDEQIEEAFRNISLAKDYTRLEQLCILALTPLVNRKTFTKRTAFILSTTKGNIRSLEGSKTPVPDVYLAATAGKIAGFFSFISAPVVISQACISGLQAIATAKRLIQCGMYDDAYVVAADELSEFVISGFRAFKALSEAPCRPYDRERKGINLGEAAAAVYISSDNERNNNSFRILGESCINDAHHISGPSRTGEGLYKSMRSALNDSGIRPEQIDFISAHGTATLYNDEMEATAFSRAHLQQQPVHSMKGYFGHTLGASGLLETVLSMESARRNRLIVSKGYEERGTTAAINVCTAATEKNIRYFMKTASGFGGCNASMIIEKV